tara:strand:- start:3677 stop:3994 length:318 start_codon:yes stop_codon:yes gene_type:complete
MKLTELFEDTSVDILTSEVKDLLYFLKAKGVSEIETDLLMKKIRDGDKESIIDLLNTMPDIVQTANTEIVQLVQSSAVASTDNAQSQDQSAEKVAKMAAVANDLT